jgi:hypothetical protein
MKCKWDPRELNKIDQHNNNKSKFHVETQ